MCIYLFVCSELIEGCLPPNSGVFRYKIECQDYSEMLYYYIQELYWNPKFSKISLVFTAGGILVT